MNKAILRISYVDALTSIAPLDDSPRRIIKPGSLPRGTCILAVHENYQTRSIDFVLQNAEFPETAPGCELPRITPIEWQIVGTRKRSKKKTK